MLQTITREKVSQAVGGNGTAYRELISVLEILDGRGETYYVDSVTGSDDYDGRDWSSAKETLDAAIALCSANRGDRILVAPGHAESITGAGGVTVNVAGVTIVGLGSGSARPTITFSSATAASFNITAAGVVVTNCIFVNAVDSQTAMVNISAADCVIAGNEFRLGDACTQAVLGILTTASASRLLVKGNYMHGSVDAGVSAAVRVVGGDAVVIEDNLIVGAFATTGCISNITAASTMLGIRRNHLLNKTADGNNKLIVVDGSTTGLIAENRGGIIDSTCPAPVTAAAMHVGGNWFSTAAGVAASVLM